jgi:RimJ/RimL family protein N-acetyltransferase
VQKFATPQGRECKLVSERKNQYDQEIGSAVQGWSGCPRPQRNAMQGRYCRLEPVDVERHAADLFSAYMEAPDGRDWTYLFAERPETDAVFRDYLAKLTMTEDPLHYTIVDARTAQAVGTAALMRIDPMHGVIEVGSITYSPRMKRSRVGTEAMYLLMRLAFDELGYRRFEWKCDSLNAASRAAAVRYGFTFEGIFRRAIVYKGRSRDTAWYSITAEEWPRMRLAFETWLAPENFDGSGRQRRQLSTIRAAHRSEQPNA